MFADLGTGKLTLVEIKTITPVDFETLVGPLAEHRVRTCLYLALADHGDNPYRDAIHLDRAKVLYVSRAFGKLHPEYGKVIPFKEFDVARDDASLTPALENAAKVKLFKDKKVLPARICESSFCSRSKACTVSFPCWSGKFH